MPQLKGLIFDLDGTLIDSAPDLRQAVNAMLNEHRRRSLTLDEVKQAVGDGMIPMITRAFELTGGVPPEFDSYAYFQNFIRHYRTMEPDKGQVYPGGREAIERYHKAGVKLGICTNKQEAATVELLKDLDLAQCFTFIAGGDTFPVHKPNPGHVQGVMKKLGVAVGECVMVGDGPNDVGAAHGAHIPVIVVTHGYSDDYARLGADRLIGGFDELDGALKALGFEIG